MLVYIASGLLCLGFGLLGVAFCLKFVDPEQKLTTPRNLYKPAAACIILGVVFVLAAYGNAHPTTHAASAYALHY